MSPSFVLPSVWSSEQLALDRAASIETFVDSRKLADPVRWEQQYAATTDLVVEVFAATNDLRDIDSDALLHESEKYWHVLRYCFGPPVSEEDLWTYVGGPKFKKVPIDWATQTALVFHDFVDDVRFPWIA